MFIPIINQCLWPVNAVDASCFSICMLAWTT